MTSPPLGFRFIYEPEDDFQELDAYDAGQALWGIARSLAITTHYAINRQVIKQAPALSGARILVAPPRAGSFEFALSVLPFASEFAKDMAPSIAASVLYDLVRLLYRRATGLKDAPETQALHDLLKRVPGDIDALGDAIDEDVRRFHRPFEGPVVNLKTYGGVNNFGTFDKSTYEFVKARDLGPRDEVFIGNVASLNGNTDFGRIWMPTEQRTVPFRKDKSLRRLQKADRVLLSWSLDEYVNGRDGTIQVTGSAIRNREQKIKVIFVASVDNRRDAA